MAESLMFTGARAVFKINNTKVGYARNVNVSEEIQYQPIEVLDNIEVEEWTPAGYTVRLRASRFRIVGQSLKSLGMFPNTGTDSAQHLINVLTTGDLSADIMDTRTNKIISKVTGVKITSHNWTVDARGVVGEDIEFVAKRTLDESEI